MPQLSDWAAGLGLRVPIACAPMGGVAGGGLAAAVSAAGALGMIGMGSAGSAAVLRRELEAFRAAGGGEAPWGIGMVDWGIHRDPEMLEVALDARPSVIAVSFGEWGVDPHPAWIGAAHAAGALAVTQVATADEARRAAAAGIDAVVARGREAGGHGEHVRPRRDLLAEVLDAVAETGATPVPVLAAGAIHSAADVAEALGMGASGAWVGTAFSACTEALTSDAARRVLFAARGEDTLVTRVYDVVLGRPWPERLPERLVPTPFIERWQGREDELARDEAARAEFRAAVAADDYSVVPVDAGEGVTALEEERTAAEVVQELAEGLRAGPTTGA